MVRAGVFIGVDRSGPLQRLRDAASGAQRMHQWAIEQGMPDHTHAKLITDADGEKVTPDMILDAIDDLLKGPGLDQLIVYFAGHGVNKNRGEHWLLSEAPVREHHAVNLKGSVEAARYSGVGHVVFISDACRVAPDGIQAQNVFGVDIFPNDGAGRTKPVDQFFACLLGRVATEIKDPAAAANGYRALYTSALVEALSGDRPEVLEPSAVSGDTAQYVMGPRLETFLEQDIPRRVSAMGLAGRVNQEPDAIITVHPNWLSRLATPPGAAISRGGGAASTGSPPPAPPGGTPSAGAVTQDLVRMAATAPSSILSTALTDLQATSARDAGELAVTAQQVATPFGPGSHETQCGIKVRGALIEEFVVRNNAASIAYAFGHGDDLRVDDIAAPISVLLRFSGDVCTVVPVVPGFLTALTFNEGELLDVALEPSTNTWRWDLYVGKADEVRALRGMAAAAARQGRFRLDGPEAMAVAQRMQYAKGVDPALAIYAAYAYHDLERGDRLRQMSRYLRDDLTVGLFDVAMLARELIDQNIDAAAQVVPFAPMLAQGWALLRANRVRLRDSLVAIVPALKDSVWSLYERAAFDRLRSVIEQGEVR